MLRSEVDSYANIALIHFLRQMAYARRLALLEQISSEQTETAQVNHCLDMSLAIVLIIHFIF